MNVQKNQQLWETIFQNKEWGKYPSEELIRFVARNFYAAPDRKKIKILELGLGTGANVWYMTREGFSVSGIEWSEIGCNRCAKRLEQEGLSPFLETIKQGDYAEKIDEFADDYFDAWIDCASLTCNTFDKAKTIVEKAIKKLKVGGKFFSITPMEGTFGLFEDKNVGYHACMPVEGNYAHTGFVRYVTDKDIQSLYSGENYSITQFYTVKTFANDVMMNAMAVIEGVRNA